MPKAHKQTLKDGLQFEKKNQNLLKLPKYARVHKRPIPHPPAASPYVGASVPKIVYVATKTPFMSAVTRVQKLLRQAERRATADLRGNGGRKSYGHKTEDEGSLAARLAKAQEALAREKVYIKATGRAIEKALSIGRWFEQKSEEYAVRTQTGSVMVVDDILEDEDAKKKEEKELANATSQDQPQKMLSDNDKEDIAMEVDHDNETSEPVNLSKDEASIPAPSNVKTTESKNQRKRRRKKKLALDADEELPESRTRWVNMVEIAVNLK